MTTRINLRDKDRLEIVVDGRTIVVELAKRNPEKGTGYVATLRIPPEATVTRFAGHAPEPLKAAPLRLALRRVQG